MLITFFINFASAIKITTFMIIFDIMIIEILIQYAIENDFFLLIKKEGSISEIDWTSN